MAESFGSDPERYDRTRPRYPDAMVDAVVAASPGPDFLDVGVGVGIAARQFQAAGCRVLGVDVDARMADFARRSGLEVGVGGLGEPEQWRFDREQSYTRDQWLDQMPMATTASSRQPGWRSC